MQKSEQITLIGILLNILLFILKISVGLVSGSLAIMSDAFNSLTDILSYSGVYLAVRISNKKPDDDHQFGHKRAEPIAGLIMSIFAGVLGLEIIRAAFISTFKSYAPDIAHSAVIVMVLTIITKLFMFLYYSKQGKALDSPAIRAAGIDSRNDVFVSSVALISIMGVGFGYPVLDSIAALVISIFIFYSGYRIAKENINYLMGKSPPKDYLRLIKAAVAKIDGVRGINDVRAHYVGNKIHIEIHIEVDKMLTTKKSHDIGKKAQFAVEDFKYVEKAFIHIDPT